MATEFIVGGAEGNNPDVDSAFQLTDANGVKYKIKANSTTNALEVYKNSVLAGNLGAATSGAVTQITNRATGVTLNAMSGKITTHNASLAAEASAVFVVTNSYVAIGDVVVLSMRSGSVALNTECVVSAVANGSFSITVINGNVAAGTAETGAIVINFVVIKSPASTLA